MDSPEPSIPLVFSDHRRASLETLEALSAPPTDRSLILGLHGRGSSPQRLLPFAPVGMPNAHHVLARGPFSFEEGAAWYLGRPAPLAELRRSVDETQALLQSLWKEGHRPERTVLWGFSQGAMLALQLTAQSPVPFAGTVAIAGKLHASLTKNPALLERVKGRRFLLIHGRADTVILPEDGEEARDRLRAAGADVRWEEHPWAHALSAQVTAWIEAFSLSVISR